MIDYYLNISELKTESRIQECYDYYLEKDQTFDEYYKEYDIISEVRTSCDTDDKNIFFKNGNRLPIKTCFMKCCLLESIQRCIDELTTREINDSESYLNEEINNYKDDFEYYPDSIETDIPDKLFAKEELRRHVISSEVGTIDDKCNSKFFELAPHQLFLKNWMSPNTPYKSLLVFHGVGVGKTCSGISMAENFKDVYGKKEKRIIILAAGPIQQGWKKTIYNPEGGSHQCTADTYNIDRGEPLTLKKRDTKAKQIVKTYYELSAYTAFANRVKRLLETRLQSFKHATPEEIETEEKRIIREEFSNRMLIIDEVHNIRSNDDETTRDTITYIMKVIKYSDNLRLVLLTANPMFNQPDEIVWIINMLLANENHSLISQSIFTNGVLTPEGEQILRNVCRGYVSYMRGENPVSFPLRLYPEGPMMLTKDMSYTSSYVNGTTESLQFLELYSTYLKHHQHGH